MKCTFCKEDPGLLLFVPVQDERRKDGALVVGMACERCALERGLVCLLHRSPVLHIQWGESQHLCPECRQVMRHQLASFAPSITTALVGSLLPLDLEVLREWAADSSNFEQGIDQVLLGAIVDYSLYRESSVERALREICQGKSAYNLVPPAWQSELRALENPLRLTASAVDTKQQ